MALISSVLFVILALSIQAHVVVGLPQSHSKGNTIQSTPCMDHTDCDHLKNAKCVNSFCMCNGTKTCEDKEEASEIVVSKLGGKCKTNFGCNIDHAICKNGKCACPNGRVASVDERHCLEVATGLGGSCEDSVQCEAKQPNSKCQNEKCVCEEHMHEYNGSCYKDATIGSPCTMTGECAMTQFALCGEDLHCACQEGYVANEAKNKCLEIATKRDAPCEEDIQCSTKFGAALCKEGHCSCREMYQYKWHVDKCVRDLMLGEACADHESCHGPEHGATRLECVLGVCKCQSQYVETNGYCEEPNASRNLRPSFGFIFVVFLLSLLYV